MSGFRVADEELLHEGYAFTMHRVEVTDPGGGVFQREVVRHRGAVSVVPLHDDGTVTLVRQYRAALGRELLEIPAGLRDVDGEAPEVTARRELIEEAGLDAASIELLTTFQSAPGMMDEKVFVYLATGLTAVGVERQGDEEDYMTLHRHTLDELVEMIGTGELTDAKTVIGVLLAARR